MLGTGLDGFWSDVGIDCPSLTQHVDIGEGADAWSIDLVDIGSGSACGSEIDLQIELTALKALRVWIPA